METEWTRHWSVIFFETTDLNVGCIDQIGPHWPLFEVYGSTSTTGWVWYENSIDSLCGLAQPWTRLSLDQGKIRPLISYSFSLGSSLPIIHMVWHVIDLSRSGDDARLSFVVMNLMMELISRFILSRTRFVWLFLLLLVDQWNISVVFWKTKQRVLEMF